MCFHIHIKLSANNIQYNLTNIDIITKIDKDFEQVIAQYYQRNTEKFEAYYKRKP